jgi:hypothetical protein
MYSLSLSLSLSLSCSTAQTVTRNAGFTQALMTFLMILLVVIFLFGKKS